MTTHGHCGLASPWPDPRPLSAAAAEAVQAGSLQAAVALARARSPGGLAPMQGPTGIGHNHPKELQPLEKDCVRLEKAAPRAGGDRGPCVWPEVRSGRETATGRLVSPIRPQGLPLGPPSSSQDPALRGNAPSLTTD